MFDTGFRLAKVVRVYPGGASVDIVNYDDGSPMSNVQVLSPVASTNCGMNDLPSPTAPPDGEWGLQASGGRDMIAVVGFIRGQPLVFGFLFPQVSQMLFDHMNRMVYRHASDVYWTIDGSGNAEFFHPSGAYVRFGTSSAHEDLTGQDFDGKWAIPSRPPVHIHVEQAGGTAVLNIDPPGNISLTHAGNLTTNTGGNLSATVAGTTSVNSTGAMSLTAPTITLNGNTVINGPLTQGMGGNGGGCSMLGPLTVTGDVTGNNVTLSTHNHSGVTTGGGQTGDPVQGT